MKNILCFILFFCFLLSACKVKDITKVDPAKCIDETKINPKQECEWVFEPVCGCNQKTYPNECYAKRDGVTIWVDGQCKDVIKEEETPVKQ